MTVSKTTKAEPLSGDYVMVKLWGILAMPVEVAPHLTRSFLIDEKYVDSTNEAQALTHKLVRSVAGKPETRQGPAAWPRGSACEHQRRVGKNTAHQLAIQDV